MLGDPNATTATTPTPKMMKSHEGEHHGDFGGTEIVITPSLRKFALCAALNSCNLGYDIGVSTNVGYVIQKDWELSDPRRELLIGSINLWALVGAFLSGYFSDRFGRRRTFLVASIGFIIGVIIMAMAGTWMMLMIGRFFVGIGVGVGMAIDPVYIAELSPAKIRGFMVSWSEIAINAGICMGFSSGLILGGLADSTKWRVMLLLGAVMPTILIYLVRNVMPESPRWLVSRNRESEAREILQMAYPQGYNVDFVIEDIKLALQREEMAEKTLGWSAIFHPTPAFRRMLIVGIGIAIAQQLSGIDAIQYYIMDVLEGAGIESDTKKSIILIILGLIKLSVTIVVSTRLDVSGRRFYVLLSLFGMSLTLLVMAFVFKLDASPGAPVTVLCLGGFLVFFAVGIGPGAWLIPSETFATSIRAKAMSLATTSNRFTAFVMSSTFLTAEDKMGWDGFFLLLSIITVLMAVFFYFFLPETKGRSLEDMSFYFAEVTGDKSILEAERKIRGEIELSATPSVKVTPEASDEAPQAGTMA